MDAKALLDEVRLSFQSDSTIAPTRPIIYTHEATRIPLTHNAFVGVGSFNKIEREEIGRFQSFGGLPLLVTPTVDDLITYDGIKWKVVRWVKTGQMYTVYCENKFHNGKPK